MSRLLLVLAAASASIALGYATVHLVQYYTDVPEVTEAPSLDVEMKEMIIFMNPAITEEIANKYLEELRKLNETYGYVRGGNPKGDTQTMREYGEKIDELQRKYSIIPTIDESTHGSQSTGLKRPALAPKSADPSYVPPSVQSESNTATSSPALQQQPTVKPSGPPAASPTGSAAKGGPASSPPLIEQENIPPAPPLPAMMQSE